MQLVHLTASTMFGGPERQMLGLAEHLPEPWQTHFLSFPEGGRCQPFLHAAQSRGYPAEAISADTPRFRSAIREITARLSAIQADILLCHGYKSNLLGRIAAKRLGIPAIAVSRGWTGENRKIRFYESLDRRHLRWMDHVVAVSEGQAQKVRQWGVPPDRLSIIRNSARLEAFATANPSDRDHLIQCFPDKIDSGPIVLAAGRLSPEKGFDILVEAAAAIPFARFVLFGEGVERGKLEKRIRVLRLGDRFILPGFTEKLDYYMPWADLFVLPSYTEGLPNVALEASAAGVAVVATRVGGTPEVVVDGVTGYLVPPGSPTELAKAIVHLLDQNERRQQMGQAGKRRVESEFTFAGQAKMYHALFSRLIPESAAIAS